MRNTVLVTLACLFCFGFTSCDDSRPIPDGPLGKAEDLVLKEKIGGLETQLADALKTRDAAVAAKDRIGTLVASKDAAAAEAALYRQKAAELDAYGKTLDKQLRLEREAEIQGKLYWATGITLGLSLVALGFGLWLGLRRLVVGALCGIGLAGACWFLAFLVPYLLWIGGAVLGVGVLVLAVMLYRRHVSLRQLVGALEAAKPLDGAKSMIIENYKTFLPQHLDTASEEIIAQIRAVATKVKKARVVQAALAATVDVPRG